MPPAPTNGNPMADIVDELATFIAATLNMQLGVNVWVGELPETGLGGVPSSAINSLYFIQMPGPAPDPYIDTETYIIDVWSTGSDSVSAKSLLRSVYDILHRKGNYELNNWYIYFSEASSTIRDESRGREGNKLFALTITLISRNLNNIS
jgi:hypothetical protein